MTTLLLLPQFSLAALPMILLVILIIVLFAAILFLILDKMREPIRGWAMWIAMILGGILLLWFLISLAGQ